MPNRYRADGTLPLARTGRRNGATNKRRVQRARLVKATNGEVIPAVPVEPDEPAVRLTGRRERRNPPVATVARTRKGSSRRLSAA